MAVWQAIANFFVGLWSLFVYWLSIFIAPFSNSEMLWILIPIWLSWFFSEFFQEKEGTSLGNAISNGFIPLWAGLDWMRYLLRQVNVGALFVTPETVIKFSICVLVLLYGLIVITAGIRARRITSLIGRIREITYVMVIFTPVIYGVIQLSWYLMLAAVLFFPVFYFVIEFIDRRVPSPKSLQRDMQGGM